MKVAIVGSRDLEYFDFGDILPEEVTCIVSGGARGIDRCAAEYARANGLALEEYKPDYRRYGKGAPLRRNRQIVDAADEVIALCRAYSRSTMNVLDYAIGKKPITLYSFKEDRENSMIIRVDLEENITIDSMYEVSDEKQAEMWRKFQELMDLYNQCRKNQLISRQDQEPDD